MNKHSPSLSKDLIYEVRRLMEIVRQRKTVEIHSGNPEELDAVRPIEALLGVHQTPTLKIALSRVENRSDSQIFEYPETCLVER